jgi:ribosome-associated protein
MSKLSPEQAISTQQSGISTRANFDGYELAKQIAEAANDKKAQDIVLLKVSDVSYLADYFVIITGFSQTQLKAIAEFIEDQVEETFNLQPIRVSGKKEANWVVQDYGSVIVHIFLPEDREYYDLESFWGHAERIDFFQHS